MNPIALSEGPYHYMSPAHRAQVTFQTPEGPRTFIVLISTAYNAYGLIGSEHNGIVVLDCDRMQVASDQIARELSGWGGPSAFQLATFKWMTDPARWDDFRRAVNDSKRARYAI